MLRAAAHFPDALVGLLPDSLEMSTAAPLEMPRRPRSRDAATPRLMQRVHHLAEDVELELAVRGVADAHRPRALVAGQPGHLPLEQPALAARGRT